MIKKLSILIFLIILLTCTNAIPFGNETQDAVILPGSFKMMSRPELDSEFFIQFQIVGTDGNGLDGYHTELKIYDNRGVLIFPKKPAYLTFGGSRILSGEFAFADSNGFVNHSVFLPSCGFFSDGEFCFQLQQTYTATITGRGLFRQENFVPQIKQIETNWIGDFMRFFAINSQGIFILAVAFVVVGSLVSLFLMRRKHGN